MNALDLLLSSALAALLLLGLVESITRFVRLASFTQSAFNAKVTREYQPLICPDPPTTFSVTCSQGERKVVQFHTTYKRLDE